MPYLVKGNAQQLFSAFGYPQLVMLHDKIDNPVSRDLSRTHFLGNEIQANQHVNIWSQEAASKYYTQGNQSAEILKLLLGVEPLKKNHEEAEEYKRHFVCLSFAYIDDKQENCGLMVMYRRDNPEQWMIGFTRKAHINPKNRPILLLSSVDVKKYLQNPEFDVEFNDDLLAKDQFLAQLNMAFVSELLQEAFNTDEEAINPRFERVCLLLRCINNAENGAKITDPVDFSQINVARLFAENPALDRIVKYNVPFSSAMLYDCLSEHSSLCQELEQVELSEDKHISRNILCMTAVLYEEQVINKKKGVLEQNRHLLQDHRFIKEFSGYMWDREQIILLPVLHQRKYPVELIQLILSEEPYFRAVNRLAGLHPGIGFTQNVPQYFQDAQKLDALKYIDEINDEDCKRLCLIFWATNSLTIEGYQQIVTAAKAYPLMASTLVSLAQKGTVPGGMGGLKQLALDPSKHLKESIMVHFFANSAEMHYLKTLNQMPLKQLKATSQALQVLRSSAVTEQADYRLVLNADKKGTALRIFLPQIAGIRDITQRQALVGILYAGVKHGIPIQGDEVLKIKNREQQAIAKKLRERFICVTQLQDLHFSSEMIHFAASEHDKKAECFRKIILRVEDQCKTISTRLSKSAAYRDMLCQWNKQEATYRKNLYSIAYDALMNPQNNAQDAFLEAKGRIKSAEKEILEIVDPERTSEVSRFFIVLSNVVITLLSIGLLNYIKEKVTGNYWFFTQSSSGEEVRVLSKKIIDSLQPEPEALPDALKV